MRLNGHIIQFSLKIGFRKMVAMGLSEIRRRMNSNEIHFGFHFDLDQEIQVNQTPFPLRIRPISPEDIPKLFYSSTNHLTNDEIRERLQRLLFYKAAVPTCFVAAETNQFPCALCWLITSRENIMIGKYFKDGLPHLKPDEVLLEFIFVHPDYRRRKLMEWISKKLFVKAKSMGANCAIAYVRGDNTISLAGTRLIGWKPFLKKNITWKFFKRSTTYEPLKTGRLEKKI